MKQVSVTLKVTVVEGQWISAKKSPWLTKKVLPELLRDTWINSVDLTLAPAWRMQSVVEILDCRLSEASNHVS